MHADGSGLVAFTGANSWRMSHNNYRESVYDLADAMGTVVWDENRDLRQMGLAAMSKMVRPFHTDSKLTVLFWNRERERERERERDRIVFSKTHYYGQCIMSLTVVCMR